MQSVLLVLLTLVSVALITLIMLQVRGGGVGTAFGGTSEVYRSRRGVEKLMHYATIALAVLFALISFGFIFVS